MAQGQSGQGVVGTPAPAAPRTSPASCSQNVTGTRFQFVPYRGTAPVIRTWSPARSTWRSSIHHRLPQFRAGRIKVFAVMAKSRTANAPEIPTVDEAGAPGLHIAPWQAMWAPKGTPKNRRPAQRRGGRCAGRSGDPQEAGRPELRVGPREEQTPEYLAAFHKAEIEKWWPIIKAAGIKGG